METQSSRPAGPLPVVALVVALIGLVVAAVSTNLALIGLLVGAAGLVIAAVALQRGQRGPLPIGGALVGIAAIVVGLIRILTA